MKRILILCITALFGLIMLAQTEMNFHLIGNVVESLRVSDIDTIRFSQGDIVIEGAENKTFHVADVDSATFSLESVPMAEGDTVFVIYDNDKAMVINPYGNVYETVSGADVTIVSEEGLKGIVYCLSGTSTEGSFNFTPDRGYILVFDNLNLGGSAAPMVLNQGLDGESYTATVRLRGTSSLSDGENNNLKAALYTKSKLKISYDSTFVSNGSLTVTGKKKHAVNSSKRIELYSGNLIIDGAVGDGINADGLEVYNGELNISHTSGDGVDCSEVIQIFDGMVSVSVGANDVKGMKCDSIIEVRGGTVSVDVEGSGAKAIKSGLKTTISAGSVVANLNGKEAFYDSASDDYSYNVAIKSDNSIELNGTGSLTVRGAGIAARGLSSDGTVVINGGTLDLNLTGTYNIESSDTTSLFGIKADTTVSVLDGKIEMILADNANIAKGIKSDYVYVKGGAIDITNNGGYWYTLKTTTSSGGGGFGGFGGRTSSTQTSVSSTPKCIRGEKLVSITGGILNLTCAHGKGVTSDNSVIIGTEGGSDSDLSLSITAGTSSDETYTKGGENSRTKYCCAPKAINCDKTVVINSGTVTARVFDTGVKGSDVTVNGGKITIDAKYDQGIHGVQTLTVNDGDIYVIDSYEAFEAVTVTMNGGITSIYSSNDGWNASCSSSGTGTPHIYVKGGYHYLNVGSGDTDCLDSNGGMTFSGGVLIVEGGSTLDGGDGNNFSFTYTGGKLMLFGSGVENSPSGATTSSGAAGSANTLYTAASNGTVLSAFTTAKSSKNLYFLYNSSTSLMSGGTLSNVTKTVDFRWTNNSVLTYSEGGTISGGTALGAASSSGGGPGGGGRNW